MLYGVPAHWVRVQSRRVQINNIATTQQQQPLPQHQRQCDTMTGPNVHAATATIAARGQHPTRAPHREPARFVLQVARHHGPPPLRAPPFFLLFPSCHSSGPATVVVVVAVAVVMALAIRTCMAWRVRACVRAWCERQ